MALGNLMVAESYTIIDNVTLNKELKFLNFEVIVFKTSAKEQIIANSLYTIQDGTVFDTYFAISVLSPVDQNILKKCYDYLKTLDGYTSLTDI